MRRQSFFGQLMRIVIVLSIVLPVIPTPSISAFAADYINTFETAGTKSDFVFSGTAEAYINSGMLKLRASDPMGTAADSGFIRCLPEPVYRAGENTAILEMHILFSSVQNVKNIFVTDNGMPLVVLDNGNKGSSPNKVGILANTGAGQVQLKPRSEEENSAYTANEWHFICAALYPDGFDVYFDDEKLNNGRLSLPKDITEISSCGMNMRVWTAETALVDEFRMTAMTETKIESAELTESCKGYLTFTNPIEKDSLAALRVTSSNGTEVIEPVLQEDRRTVVLNFSSKLQNRSDYTVSYSGLKDIFGNPLTGTVTLRYDAPQTNREVFVDELDSLAVGVNHVVSYTKNGDGNPAFYFDTESPEDYCGDKTRLFLNSNTGPSEIVYHLPDGIDSCRVFTFEAERSAPPRYDLAAEISSDGKIFYPIALNRSKLDIQPGNTAFGAYTYESCIAESDITYFKLIFRRAAEDTSTTSAWTPKVARIALNCLSDNKVCMTESYPAAGETDVSPSQKISLTFNQELNADSLAEAFLLNDAPVSADLGMDQKTVTLSAALQYGKEYTVRIKDNLCSKEGKSGIASFFRFHTAARAMVAFRDGQGETVTAIPPSGAIQALVQTGESTFVTVCTEDSAGQQLQIQGQTVDGEHVFSLEQVPHDGRIRVFFWDSTKSLLPISNSICITKDGVTETPVSAGKLNDSYDDFNKITFAYGDFMLEQGYAAAYGGDESRMSCGAGSGEIVYRLPADLKAVRLLTYTERNNAGNVAIYGSSDGRVYTALNCVETQINRIITYPMQAYESYNGIPDGIRYLKIAVSGGIVLGNLEAFYGNYDLSEVKSLVEELNYDYGESNVRLPDTQTIQTAVQAKTKGAHPRLMAEQDDFERVKNNLTQEPYQSWLIQLKKYADGLADNVESYTPVPFLATEIESEKKDFLTDIREIKKRIETLSFLWRITGETKYAQYCWKEMESVCGFPTLYPEHFLNVGEGALALAVGYDWLYDYMTPQQKQTLKNGIMRLGIKTALPYLRGGYGFVNNTNNWNSVCNGGIGVAALCFADIDAECAEAVSYAVKHIVKGFRALVPDGAYPEGPGYWDFGTKYAVYFLSALQTAAGDAFGLEQLAGLSKTGEFPLYATSPIGKTFNFADSGDGKLWAPQMFWLAKKYDNPAYGYLQCSVPSSQVYDLLWYEPACTQNPETYHLPLVKHFSGEESMAVFRQNWTDTDALYVAVKGGDNQSSHGDLDIGTFVLDALGVRWAEELGGSYYHSPGYWDFGTDAGRWNYYRKRAEGHNTLVLNPGMHPDQNVYAVADFDTVQTTSDGGFAILDMTPAYMEHVQSARRKMTVFHNSTEVLLQDKVRCGQDTDLFWFLHTSAAISLSSDRKTATLEQGGKQMMVKVLSPATAVFEQGYAVPLPESPHPSGDQLGHKKLQIHLPDTKDADIAVVFVPLWDETYKNAELPELTWDF